MTKSEVIDRIAQNGCSDLIRYTRSCTRVHAMTNLHPHCGKCSQCIDRRASDKPRKMTPDLVELIEEKLTQQQWSPDQISGRLAKDGVAFISHERIYQHVWKDKKDGGTLYLHLRHSGKKYNRRKGKNSGRGLIPNRVDIDQRPPIVAAKSRIGDWEADTIIGANHKGVVMSHVERTSKYTKLAKLPDKNADSVVPGLRTRALAAR